MRYFSIVTIVVLFILLGTLLLLSNQTNKAIRNEYQIIYDNIVSQKDTISRALFQSFIVLDKLSKQGGKDIEFDYRVLISHVKATRYIDLNTLNKLFEKDDTDVFRDLADALTRYREAGNHLISKYNSIEKNDWSKNRGESDRLFESMRSFVNNAYLYDVTLMHLEAIFSKKINDELGKTSRLIFYILICFTFVLFAVILFLLKNSRDRKKAYSQLKKNERMLRESELKLKQYSDRLEKRVEERTKELREAQEELLLKERLAVLGHFAGSISHEIRNPLAAIDSSVYLLEMILHEGNEKIRKHLGRISSNVYKATSIIESLLNLTRMEKPNAEIHDLTELITEAIHSSKLPDTIEVVPNFPGNSIGIHADKEQIRMALKNIIRNAVQAMEGRGELMISTVGIAETGRAEIRVTDTGPGIPAEYADKIFEPLFTTKAQGIGFGLSITRMIIENHGGTVRAESKTGTSVIICLPLVNDE